MAEGKRERPTAPCALCLEVRFLCESHVLSDFGYDTLYEQGIRRFYDLAGGPRPHVHYRQTGHWEHLFCEECEGFLNTLCEDYASRLLTTPGGIVVPPRGSKTLNQAEYRRFKLFQLSLLWRAHVARGEFFRQVDLGPFHAERLRTMLRAGDPGAPAEYPCVISAMLLDGQHRKDFMAPIFRAREGAHHVYAVSFFGFKWIYLVSSHSQTHWAARYALQEDGTFYVHALELRCSALAERLLDEVFLPNRENVARLRASEQRRKVKDPA